MGLDTAKELVLLALEQVEQVIPPRERVLLELPFEVIVEGPHATLEREQAGEEVADRVSVVESRADPVRPPEPSVERVQVGVERAQARARRRLGVAQSSLLVDHALDLACPVDHRLRVGERVPVPFRVVTKPLEWHDRNFNVRPARRLEISGVADDADVVVGIRPHIRGLAARAAEEESDDAVVGPCALDQLLIGQVLHTKIAQPMRSRIQRRYRSL